ncbi:HTH_48 domain-containing protein [Trichonephila clavipes]|nr:HTH_48 domain-containing protein [Trichonephila clavipes]
MSDNNFEQRCATKFCFRLGHNATETFAKLQQAYGDSVLSKAQVFRWFKALSEGIESNEDEPRSGRPSVSKTAENVVRVRDPVRSDRRLTNHLKGHHFGTLENIQTAVTDQLKAIPISEFHQCNEEWRKRPQRCVASEGSYFEGDNVEFVVPARISSQSSSHCWRSPLPHASVLIERGFGCVLGVQQTKQLPHVAKVDLVWQLGV